MPIDVVVEPGDISELNTWGGRDTKGEEGRKRGRDCDRRECKEGWTGCVDGDENAKKGRRDDRRGRGIKREK